VRFLQLPLAAPAHDPGAIAQDELLPSRLVGRFMPEPAQQGRAGARAGGLLHGLSTLSDGKTFRDSHRGFLVRQVKTPQPRKSAARGETSKQKPKSSAWHGRFGPLARYPFLAGRRRRKWSGEPDSHFLGRRQPANGLLGRESGGRSPKGRVGPVRAVTGRSAPSPTIDSKHTRRLP